MHSQQCLIHASKPTYYLNWEFHCFWKAVVYVILIKFPSFFTFVQKCVWSIPEGVAGNGRSPSRDNRWQASGGSVAHSHVRPGGCGDARQMSATYHSKCPLSKERGENSLRNVVLVNMIMQYKNIQIPLNSLAIQRKKWLKIYLIECCNFVLRGAVK